jgi:putative hydrolase of the HAD superfamily
VSPARRVVFFDAAGTLIRTRGGVGVHYAALARRFGVEVEAATLDGLFPAAFRAAPRMAFPGASPEVAAALERDWWRRLVADVFGRAGLLTGFADGGFDAYFETLYTHFESPEVWEVFPDVWPALAGLRALGAELGVLSNFDGRLLVLLERLDLARWFGSVTLSSRVGVAKPDRGIFERALACHRAVPGAALHVGDTLAEDVAGAQGAGLGAVLIDRDGRHPETPGAARLRSLADLPGLLGSGRLGPEAW